MQTESNPDCRDPDFVAHLDRLRQEMQDPANRRISAMAAILRLKLKQAGFTSDEQIIREYEACMGLGPQGLFDLDGEMARNDMRFSHSAQDVAPILFACAKKYLRAQEEGTLQALEIDMQIYMVGRMMELGPSEPERALC